MHTLDAQIDKTMHPAIFSCAHFNTEVFMHLPGAQGLKSMHPAAIMCTQGAGCTLNFKHLTTYGTYAWYDTWYIYIYLPLNNESRASLNT